MTRGTSGGSHSSGGSYSGSHHSASSSGGSHSSTSSSSGSHHSASSSSGSNSSASRSGGCHSSSISTATSGSSVGSHSLGASSPGNRWGVDCGFFGNEFIPPRSASRVDIGGDPYLLMDPSSNDLGPTPSYGSHRSAFSVPTDMPEIAMGPASLPGDGTSYTPTSRPQFDAGRLKQGSREDHTHAAHYISRKDLDFMQSVLGAPKFSEFDQKNWHDWNGVCRQAIRIKSEYGNLVLDPRYDEEVRNSISTGDPLSYAGAHRAQMKHDVLSLLPPSLPGRNEFKMALETLVTKDGSPAVNPKPVSIVGIEMDPMDSVYGSAKDVNIQIQRYH